MLPTKVQDGQYSLILQDDLDCSDDCYVDPDEHIMSSDDDDGFKSMIGEDDENLGIDAEDDFSDESEEEEVFDSTQHRALPNKTGASLMQPNLGNKSKYKLLSNRSGGKWAAKRHGKQPHWTVVLLEMTPLQKVFFITSISFGILIVSTFLFVLPCDLDSCDTGIDNGPTQWFLEVNNVGFNFTTLVMKPRRVLFLAFYTIGHFSTFSYDVPTSSDTGESKPMGHLHPKRCGLLGINEADGTELWRVNLRACPTNIDCTLMDVTGDGFPDCLLTGPTMATLVFDPVKGRIVWLLKLIRSHRQSAVIPDTFGSPILLQDLDNDGYPELLFPANSHSRDVQPAKAARIEDSPKMSRETGGAVKDPSFKVNKSSKENQLNKSQSLKDNSINSSHETDTKNKSSQDILDDSMQDVNNLLNSSHHKDNLVFSSPVGASTTINHSREESTLSTEQFMNVKEEKSNKSHSKVDDRPIETVKDIPKKHEVPNIERSSRSVSDAQSGQSFVVLVSGRNGLQLGEYTTMSNCQKILNLFGEDDSIGYSCVMANRGELTGKIPLSSLLSDIGFDNNNTQRVTKKIPERNDAVCKIKYTNTGQCPHCKAKIELGSLDTVPRFEEHQHSAVVSWKIISHRNVCRAAVVKLWKFSTDDVPSITFEGSKASIFSDIALKASADSPVETKITTTTSTKVPPVNDQLNIPAENRYNTTDRGPTDSTKRVGLWEISTREHDSERDGENYPNLDESGREKVKFIPPPPGYRLQRLREIFMLYLFNGSSWRQMELGSMEVFQLCNETCYPRAEDQKNSVFVEGSIGRTSKWNFYVSSSTFTAESSEEQDDFTWTMESYVRKMIAKIR